MHDIWNPWHGCVKCSEGCEHCYMYFLDALRDKDGSEIYKTKTGFNYPLQKNRQGQYKIKSGEHIRVCMTSDFFLEEADQWRNEVWNIMRQRPDVIFFLLTKRPQRIKDHLPHDWGDGWENIILNATCENQRRADERVPILLDIPAKHKGIMCAPFIGPISLEPYLSTGQIEQVNCGGENYDGCRPCYHDWVVTLSNECRKHDVTFCFLETGTKFIKDGIQYFMPKKSVQREQAFLSGLSYIGKPMQFKLTDINGNSLTQNQLHVPYFGVPCQTCARQPFCNGCSQCEKCQ